VRPAYEKSEDHVYVLEHSIPIDKEYYIEQQLRKPVERLFEPILENTAALFCGEHTKIIRTTSGMHGPLNAFLTRSDECIGCRKTGSVIYSVCRRDFPRHFSTLLKIYNDKTAIFNGCWVDCQRCQGRIINEVICINRICPIWYKRVRVKKELATLQVTVDKLSKLTW
jgi:DNA polymerase delta subunit 1